jgi:flagellar protein FlaG
MSIEVINIQNKSALNTPTALHPSALEREVTEASKPILKIHEVDIDLNPGFSAEDVKNKIADLNRALSERKQSVAFSTDAATGHSVVTVSNLTTGELIRQMPTVEALNAMKNLDHMMGLIFSERI